MFEQLFRGWTPIIILVVVVLLFGAGRLPALARSLGQSRNVLRAELKKGEDEDTRAQPADGSPAGNSFAASDDQSIPPN